VAAQHRQAGPASAGLGAYQHPRTVPATGDGEGDGDGDEQVPGGEVTVGPRWSRPARRPPVASKIMPGRRLLSSRAA
jgi:hypothetical protein